jgi:hypothetical protein
MGRRAGAVAGSIALPWFLSITRAMTGYGSEVKEARMVDVRATVVVPGELSSN